MTTCATGIVQDMQYQLVSLSVAELPTTRRQSHEHSMFPYYTSDLNSIHRTAARAAIVSQRAALAMELVAAHTEEAAKARQESALNAAKFRRASRDAGQASAAPTTGALEKPQRAGGRPPTVSGNRCVASKGAKHATLLSAREMRRMLVPKSFMPSGKVMGRKDMAWKSLGTPPLPAERWKEACSLFPLLPRNPPPPRLDHKTHTPFYYLVGEPCTSNITGAWKYLVYVVRALNDRVPLDHKGKRRLTSVWTATARP